MFKVHGDHTQSNQLLGALEPDSRARINSALEPIKLKLGAVVCDAGGILKHAYFPEGAVLSLLTVMEDGPAIEPSNIGREGALGRFAAMYSRTSSTRSMVQFRGLLLRCHMESWQPESKHSHPARSLCAR